MIEQTTLSVARVLLDYGALGVLILILIGIGILLWRKLGQRDVEAKERHEEVVDLARDAHDVMRANTEASTRLATLIEAKLR